VQPQVKNRHETISTEEKLHVSRLEEGQGIIDICRNVRLAHNKVCTIHEYADRIKDSAKSGTKRVCLHSKPTVSPISMNRTKIVDASLIF
jgi:hypothetical protein